MPNYGGCPLGHNAPDNASAEKSDAPPSLSDKRLESTIPKTDSAADTHWMYPSERQFHSALLRKGMPTDEEDVPAMVEIHNFLNEGAWKEIQNWEKIIDR